MQQLSPFKVDWLVSFPIDPNGVSAVPGIPEERPNLPSDWEIINGLESLRSCQYGFPSFYGGGLEDCNCVLVIVASYSVKPVVDDDESSHIVYSLLL
jgi:hypothetical protein